MTRYPLANISYRDLESLEQDFEARKFIERVRASQDKLAADLKPHYDFSVCGSGSSGSVVARRLAENRDVDVLLAEAGGSDDVAEVMEASKWPLNRASERNWGFLGQPSHYVNGRSIPLHMGKVLGGGSSVNAMAWAHGHKNDWDFFASEAGDPAWNYESVSKINRRIEDGRGAPEQDYRGKGGLVFVQPPPDHNPIAPAMLEGARSVGIPVFKGHNGRMMEGDGGAYLCELRLRNGKRRSVFRSYTFPYMDRPNLTVVSRAMVTCLVFEGKRATGVEITYENKTHRIGAGFEVILSLGAMHTPKLLMQSGIGDQAELQRFGIPLVHHLPGVGRNFQNHLSIAFIFDYQEPIPPRNNAGDAMFFWKSHPTR